MDDIGEDSNTGELHYLSKKPLTCHDNIYVQVSKCYRIEGRLCFNLLFNLVKEIVSHLQP